MQADRTEAIDIVRQWVREAQLVGDGDCFAGKRGQPRYPWQRPMELLIGGEVLYVQSRDISIDGLGLFCRRNLPQHDIVQIRRDENDPWVPARVAHVTQTVGGSKVGLDLDFCT